MRSRIGSGLSRETVTTTAGRCGTPRLTLASSTEPATVVPGQLVSCSLDLNTSAQCAPAGKVRIEIHLPRGFRPVVVSRPCHYRRGATVSCSMWEIFAGAAIAIGGGFITGSRHGTKSFTAIVMTGNLDRGQNRSTARTSSHRPRVRAPMWNPFADAQEALGERRCQRVRPRRRL